MRPSLLAVSFATTVSARNVISSSATSASTAAFFGPLVFSSAIRPSRSQVAKVKGYVPASADNNMTCRNSSSSALDFDKEYPGTAVQRLRAVRERVAQLTEADLNDRWEFVRRKILWAGGLRDLPSARPGEGYTGHSFNDWNHVDLTTMNDEVSNNTNDGQVKGIAIGNRLGEGIRRASIPELGAGGSWSTCAMGCNSNPPRDVAHMQFRSRIAFKLVWVPNENYDTFVLVDDDGKLLARGTPSDGPGGLPALRERMQNYRIMEQSKYAVAADAIASQAAAE